MEIMLRGKVALLEGRRADAEQAFTSLTSRYDVNPTAADELAILAAWLGDYDQTFRWLTKACEERGTSLPFVGVEPLVTPLADDPRCRELLRRHDLLKEPADAKPDSGSK